MVRKSVCLGMLLALGMVGSSFAQNLSNSAQAQVGPNSDSGAVHDITPQLIHSVPSELVADDSSNGPSSIAGNPGGVAGVQSVPNFTRAFVFGGTTFPFTMLGNDPSLGHRTTVPTKIVSVSLTLLNADGTTFDVVDAGEFEQAVLNSPNFQKFKYEKSGEPTQFADAVQRAEFFNHMDGNWHTELSPAVLDHVNITVPKFVNVRIGNQVVSALNYQSGLAADGHRFVLMLNLFFNQQLGIIVNNEIDAGNFTTDAINLPLFPNTFLFSLNRANPQQRGGCCTLGFHTYFTDGGSPVESRWVTDYASFISPGIFGGGFEDVTALSHEISETFNDPFVNNATPVWQFPGEPGVCQGNLETGDPVEVLANATFPVTLKTKDVVTTFHPQTEALLQWFAQTVPSDAIHGAYSYPDLTALTAPATLCH
ncbi:MAG TPA: hypothetical protein VFB79_23990 [Candidatus Angelobacter sp.]|nr:hypothetical protein [Candidatus Angelobacter sp.]